MFVGHSSLVSYTMMVKDFDSRLNLDRAIFYFPSLYKEERKIIETILQRRSTLGSGKLKVMNILDIPLTLLSNISALMYLVTNTT